MRGGEEKGEDNSLQCHPSSSSLLSSKSSISDVCQFSLIFKDLIALIVGEIRYCILHLLQALCFGISKHCNSLMELKRKVRQGNNKSPISFAYLTEL